jgi:ribosome-associated translation inhibitor RaiA
MIGAHALHLLRRTARSNLSVAVEKYQSPKIYASRPKTQTSQYAEALARSYEALAGSYEALAGALRSSPPETRRHVHAKKTMKIQINTDNHIAGREAFSEQAEATVATVASALTHLAEHVTRVEVHLSDENGDKSGVGGKRCMMEARLDSHQPIAVTDEADSLDEAIAGAAEKLMRSLGHTLSRLNDSQLAGRINALLADDDVTRCSIAISGAIHNQLLEAIAPEARSKIGRVLASNLTKTDPTELHAHFEKQLG